MGTRIILIHPGMGGTKVDSIGKQLHFKKHLKELLQKFKSFDILHSMQRLAEMANL